MLDDEAPEEYACPVCGYPSLYHPPRTPIGTPSDEICPSCGYQFGYDDDAQGISYTQWRTRWIADGMNWFSEAGRHPPDGWDPVEQLKNLEASRSE